MATDERRAIVVASRMAVMFDIEVDGDWTVGYVSWECLPDHFGATDDPEAWVRAY